MKVSVARRTAYNNLIRIEKDGAFSTELLARTDLSIDTRDRNLIHTITLGVLRKRDFLDFQISKFVKQRLDKLDIEVLTILRMSAFQLFYMDRIPAYSVINEAVELTRNVKKRSAAGMTNAVLRKLSKVEHDTQLNETIEEAALNTSHPVELLEKWKNQFGLAKAISIAEANNREPRTTFRFTAAFDLLASDEQISIRKKLGDNELVHNSDLLEDSFVCMRIEPFLRQYADEGLIYFQDEASQLAAALAVKLAGRLVLDVCAAPGSKATGISRGLKETGRLVAGELHFNRAKLLKLSALKQNSIIDVVCLNAQSDLPFPRDCFDTVLVDAPCTGTGTIRRNPEIRYRVDEADYRQLHSKQLNILLNASKTLKKGGVLIYSTCSLEQEEDEFVVSEFLESEPGYELVPGDELGLPLTGRGFIRTFPDTHDTDGFFIACLRRI